MRGLRFLICLCGMLLLGGCASALKPGAFAKTSPVFDPVKFWTGHSNSWGVIENLNGAPTEIITTTTAGTPEGNGGLHMIQHIMTKGKPTVRDWHIHALGHGRYEATASDMVGSAYGSPSGRTLHWTWTLALRPGDCLFNVQLDQWMYLADNHTLLVRTIVTKLGIRLAEISETFVRQSN